MKFMKTNYFTLILGKWVIWILHFYIDFLIHSSFFRPFFLGRNVSPSWKWVYIVILVNDKWKILSRFVLFIVMVLK